MSKQNKVLPMYGLTRDGFTLLVMGFSGKEAMKFKEAYIKAFNDMEKLLLSIAQKPLTVAEVHADMLVLASQFNLKDNQALISASNATEKLTGQNPMKLLGITHMISDHSKKHYTVTEIGQKMNPPVSARALNIILCDLGLQSKDSKGYKSTAKGHNYSVTLDTQKKHTDGTLVTQLRWYESVISVL